MKLQPCSQGIHGEGHQQSPWKKFWAGLNFYKQQIHELPNTNRGGDNTMEQLNWALSFWGDFNKDREHSHTQPHRNNWTGRHREHGGPSNSRGHICWGVGPHLPKWPLPSQHNDNGPPSSATGSNSSHHPTATTSNHRKSRGGWMHSQLPNFQESGKHFISQIVAWQKSNWKPFINGALWQAKREEIPKACWLSMLIWWW